MENPLATIDLSATLIKLATSLVILIVGLIVGSLAKRVLKKLLHELEINKVLKESGVKLPVEEFVAELTKYVIYFITIIWALTEIGLATTILHIILIVFLVIIVLFIVLAFKDFIPNITAGLFIHQKGLISKGDIIKVNNVEGEVIEVDLVETKIKTKEEDIMLIPNSVLTKSEVIKKKPAGTSTKEPPQNV